MITVDEAVELIRQHAAPCDAQEVATEFALGLVLAESIASDIDSPPYDKALMDGYAISLTQSSDSTEYTVVDEIAAGDVPHCQVGLNEATRIMTGAPIPSGADTVVMVEHVESVNKTESGQERIRVTRQPDFVGQHVMRRATSLANGQIVMTPGVELSPAHIGLLAEVGRSTVKATAKPTVAVLATGNELVSAADKPSPGQIRNSNGPMMAAAISRAGGVPQSLGVACDDRDDLAAKIKQGLQADVLVLSGGVSAGKFDLVPSVLSDVSVEQVFHKVRLKPGKPIWFGIRKTSDNRTLVFGLPGNPVSSLVCFHLFVRPTIGLLSGRPLHQEMGIGRLGAPHRQRGDRPTYFPATVNLSSDGAVIELLDWQGSADLFTLTKANCLACFPAGECEFSTGDEIQFVPI